MKTLFCSILVLMLLVSCNSVKKYNEQTSSLHAVEDLRSDVDKVYNQLKRHHPKLYQYTSKEDLDFKFDSLKTSIKSPINSREFYKKLSPVVRFVRQGHISVGSVNKRFTRKERKLLKKKKFQFYDLDFEYLNQKLWVTNVREEDSTLVGCEVFKIEDDLATDLVKLYKKRFASDGYNQTLYNRYVGKGFPYFYYKDKGFLDSLTLTFKLKDSLFNRTFKRIPKDKEQVKSAKKRKLTKIEKKNNRIAAKEKHKNDRKYGFIKKDKSYTRNFKFLEVDPTVGYMKIKAFGNRNYKKFYKESFAKLDSAKTKNLILDLRDNVGGRISEVDYLYAYLTDKNYKLIEESEVVNRLPYLSFLMSDASPNALKIVSGLFSPFIVIHNLIKTKKRDGRFYYNLRFSKEKAPKSMHYSGNLYVLINGNSFSASSLISTHLKTNKRVVFVGEETGGAYNGCVAGIYKIYEMPTSKLKIRMGLMQVETSYKQNPDGYGVKPDVKILPTIKDRNLKKDPELEWVLANIKKKKNS
ncbi:S41 family peptidase [Thalassobellus suaedae]|uniref:S41 family peptidase n=1 Tax=Thalassobellus suaedae TaxID=3074124 RepID=A0ABY9XYI2_9FLAO|nr:S41 family peptidase [Flavobacteriaceae bacterium HL-DH14]